jgi:ATP-dependent Clp protease protease subunit
VKIDGIAASAASVIAMAGDEVLMSPVAMMMIHNPATMAMGDHAEMQKAIDMLTEVKESIINAYVVKTGLSRTKLSRLMDAETWMNAGKAVELGFADGVLERIDADPVQENTASDVLYSHNAVTNILMNKLTAKYGQPEKSPEQQAKIPAMENSNPGCYAKELRDRLNLIEKYI